MFDVLCISDCCADLIFQGLPAVPTLGTEEYCQCFSIHAGGGANTPMGLARLGCRAAYWSCVGDDALGKLVWNEMEQSGLSMRFIQRGNGRKTWVSAVLATAEDRAFASYAGTSADYTGGSLNAGIRAARHVHTYLYYVQKYPDILADCRAANVPLSLDLAYDPAVTLTDVRAVLSQADIITPSQPEACLLSGEKTRTGALERLMEICPNVVITCGSEGCLAWLDGAAYRAKAPQVHAVNANGAGDLFNAGLLAARMAGRSAADQLRTACAAGAIAVTVDSCLADTFQRSAVWALAETVEVEKL